MAGHACCGLGLLVPVGVKIIFDKRCGYFLIHATGSVVSAIIKITCSQTGRQNASQVRVKTVVRVFHFLTSKSHEE